MRYNYGGSGYRSRIRPRNVGLTFLLHGLGLALVTLTPYQQKLKYQPVYTVYMVPLLEFYPNIQSSKKNFEALTTASSFSARGRPSDLKTPKTTKQTIARPGDYSLSSEPFSQSDFLRNLRSKLDKAGGETADSQNRARINQKSPSVEIPQLHLATSSNNTGISVGQVVTGSEIPDWYLTLIKDKIKENWTGKKYLTPLTALVSFRLFADGTKGYLSVEQSSGRSDFDLSALEAIRKTRDIPPIPVKLSQNYLDIVIEFSTET